jgi:hypothetical protein
MLDRPEDVKEMLWPAGAEAAARSPGIAVAVDRLAFGNDPLTSFLVRELASLVAHNPGMPLPRLADVLANRAFVAAGAHRSLVDGISQIAAGSAAQDPGGRRPEPAALGH